MRLSAFIIAILAFFVIVFILAGAMDHSYLMNDNQEVQMDLVGNIAREKTHIHSAHEHDGGDIDGSVINQLESSRPTSSTRGTSHQPVRINNNAAFTTEPAVHNPGAAGTPGDPFVIQDWDIDGGDKGYCIYIGNTTAHFIVRNCTLFNVTGGGNPPYYPDSGLVVFNATNGTALNNTLFDADKDGIFIEHCEDMEILENNCSHNTFNGIWVDSGTFGYRVMEDGGIRPTAQPFSKPNIS